MGERNTKSYLLQLVTCYKMVSYENTSIQTEQIILNNACIYSYIYKHAINFKDCDCK